ncbi:MAG TPA: phosphopantetheine-binding protein [Rhizomicrobium sp.]|jgi:acyl carrier protein|nr:phosphopantetheine-binding protein [Bryobacteraceae bacterium]
MTDEEFLKGFAEVVAADEGSVALDTPLASLEGWDSVAYLGAMVFVEENMGVTLTPDVLVTVKTPSDILLSARAMQA